MVLPHAVLLPHSLLPLHIFEDRYREMLAHSLERERMFCIALMRPGGSHAGPSMVGGLGLVRACVAKADGTSDLVLQGLKRVAFEEFVQEIPFPIARLRELKPERENVVQTEALAAKVLELCAKLKEQGAILPPALESPPPHLVNPDVLSDVAASTFIADPFQRQRLLEQPVISERLRLLIHDLGRLLTP